MSLPAAGDLRSLAERPSAQHGLVLLLLGLGALSGCHDHPVELTQAMRKGVALAIVCAVLAISGCTTNSLARRSSSTTTSRALAARSSSATSSLENGPPLVTAVLTSDQADWYSFATSTETVDISAPLTNRGSNDRYLFWPLDQIGGRDEMSCATWTAARGRTVQQGAALRVAIRGSTPVAITVTHNVFLFGPWVFNIHEWRGPIFRLVGSFNLAPVFLPPGALRPVPLPWHLCARAVGPTVEFKAWPDTEHEPLWGDSRHGGSVEVTAEWIYAGQSGWYVGHLYAGDAARFNDLKAAALTHRTPL